MTEETAKKARNILDRLCEFRSFLDQYDKMQEKFIVVRDDCLSEFKMGYEFSGDHYLNDFIREYIASQIREFEKQLEEINPSQENLQESCRIISNELQKHGEFYDAFVSCVERTLDEYDDENCVIDNGYFSPTLAEMIVKRISGEE